MGGSKRGRLLRTIRARLIASLFSLIAFAVIGVGAGLFYIGQVNEGVDRMYTQEVVPLEALDDIKSALYRIRGDALEHILAATPETETRLSGEISEQARRVVERLRQYETTRLAPEEASLHANFERDFGRYLDTVETEILPLSAGEDKEAAEEIARGQSVTEFRAARDSMNALMDYALNRAAERASTARDYYRMAVIAVLLVLAALVSVGSLVARRLTRTITGPLRDIVGYMKALGAGEYVSVPTDRTNEVGDVLVAIAETQSRLQVTAAERTLALEALRENEERFRTAFESAPIGMAIVGLDGTWLRVNDSLADIVCRSIEDLMNGPIAAVVHPDDLVTERDFFDLALMAHAPSAIQREFRLLRGDGQIVWVSASGSVVRTDHGEPVNLLLQVVDVTERRRVVAELARRAHQDDLTGLANRVLFLDRLQHALERSNRHAERLHAVLFIDVDRFKFINDSLGHRWGDDLLKLVARRISGCLRGGDTVARFGGDEFTVLLEDLRDPLEAVHVAERVLEALREPVAIAGREFVITGSIGIANTMNTWSRDDLLHDADQAMYAAKLAGKDRYALAGPKDRVRSLERLDLEADLRRGIEVGQLVLHYQPVVDLDTDVIVGCEALVRWTIPPTESYLPQSSSHSPKRQASSCHSDAGSSPKRHVRQRSGDRTHGSPARR